jgi:hypothetical protein|tara:strand:+ start:114 stop:530 length:417 start_codon:yes stop_codon:yes gene_type:complete
MNKTYTIKEFVSVDTLEHVGEKVIDWCMNKFGLSKYYDHYPYIEIDMDEIDLMGEFVGDNNEIIIYPNAMENIDDFVSTLIHEYTHYLQRPSWYTRYLNNLTLNEAIKNKHPYEIEADEVAINNWKQCKKEVLNETNN